MSVLTLRVPKLVTPAPSPTLPIVPFQSSTTNNQNSWEINGKYVSAWERRRIINEALKLPDRGHYDERLVGGGRIGDIGNNAISLTQHQQALTMASEEYPLNTYLCGWSGENPSKAGWKPSGGITIVLGFQVDHKNLQYSHDWPKPKPLLLLVAHIGGVSTTYPPRLTWAWPGQYQKLTAEQLEAWNLMCINDGDFYANVQSNIKDARKLADFYWREKTTGFQEAVEYFTAQTES